MFKKAALNLLYNIAIFGSLLGGFLAYQHENYILVLLAIVLFVIVLLQKIKLMKEIRNSGKP